MPEEEDAFDYDAGYYGEEEPCDEYGEPAEEPHELAEQYDHAYATYLDARQTFQQLKLARGYLPVVAQHRHASCCRLLLTERKRPQFCQGQR